MILEKTSNKTVRNKITENIFKQDLGDKYYFLRNKEVYIVAIAEIEGLHGLPRDATTISDELQQVLHGVVCLDTNKTITPPSALRYSRRVIARVNKKEEMQRDRRER